MTPWPCLKRLDAFRQSTDRRVSLLGAASEYVEAAGELHGRTLGEALDGYLNTVANSKREGLRQAVDGLTHSHEPRTPSAAGQGAQLSVKGAHKSAIEVRRFADAFQNTAA